MSNFEKPNQNCEKCICSNCLENVANAEKTASCSGDCAEYKYGDVFVKNDEKYLTLMDENKQIVFKCRMDDIEFFEKSIN